MRRKSKALSAVVLFSMAGASCTVPVYSHSITTMYDAAGNVTGTQETELISQSATSSSSMKVRIDHRDKIEKK